MNPILLASFILSTLVTLICIGTAMFSRDSDRQSAGIVVGFFAVLLAIATGISASQQWDKMHPSPAQPQQAEQAK